MDVFSLFDFIHEFANKTKIVDMIYNNDFLKSIKEYTALQKQQEEALAKRSRFESDCNSIQERLKVLGTQLNTQEIRQEYKKLKLQLGDASHYFALAKEEYNLCAEKMNILKKTLATLFATEFKKEKEKCILGLTQAANVKAYYLDKYLWYSAQKSRPISNFLKTANIDGEYDMKTYLKYYLKNINSESTADKEWHQYLVKVMDLL
jgi:predicted nuclease with TOPRIM domain